MECNLGYSHNTLQPGQIDNLEQCAANCIATMSRSVRSGTTSSQHTFIFTQQALAEQST